MKSIKESDTSTLNFFMSTKIKRKDAEKARAKYFKQEKQGKVLEAVFYPKSMVKEFITKIFPLIEKYAKRLIKLPAGQSLKISVGYYPIIDKHDNKWKMNILTAPIISHDNGTKINTYGIFSYDKAPKNIQTFFNDLWEHSENKNTSIPLTAEEAMGVYNFGDRHP